MDYIEEAKSGIEKLINPETEEIDSSAISVIAFSLVAIAERLDAFGASAAWSGRLARMEGGIDSRLSGQSSRIDEIERKLDSVGHERGVYDGPPIEAQPVENAKDYTERLERRLTSIGKRLDEIKRKLGTIETFSVSERLADIERRADDLESFLNNDRKGSKIE